MLLLIVAALIVISLVVLGVKRGSTKLLWIIVAICSLGVLLVLLNLVMVLNSSLPPEEVRMVVLSSLITFVATMAVAWYCFRKAKQINKAEQETVARP